MKYPIGIQTFEILRTDGYVYVDKTDLVYSLATEGKVYFLCRPRRFGKSLLISTLNSYFLGKKELFKGLKIETLEKDWKVYPVLRIDFSVGNYIKNSTLDEILDNTLHKWEVKYGVETKVEDWGYRLMHIIEAAHQQSNMRVVVLVDEYDKPILDAMSEIAGNTEKDDNTTENHNRNVLKSLYSAFKAADEHLRFVFLTGVTKFSQVSVFSGFNQPKDLTMSTQYETLCGISEQELETYFHEQIEQIAQENGCSYDKMKANLKKRYDGYHFSKKMTEVYNPFSLLNAIQDGDLRNYWFKTGTPTYLIKLMEKSNEDIYQFTDKYYSEDDFSDYRADIERPLPMIYQSGYLTIKDYDADTMEFRLDIPNNEVKQGFISLLANNYFKTADPVDSSIRTGVKALKRGDLEDFHQEFAAFLASIPYSMRRKENERERERYFHYTFYLILRLLSTYMVYTEKQLSHGRADCIIETDHYVYIFEFKLDGTAQEALQQIEDKGYATPYAADQRTLYKIGCSFSSETGTIEEWEVR